MKRGIRGNCLKKALVIALPIMCSYICVAFGYGLLMEQAGFHWYP